MNLTSVIILVLVVQSECLVSSNDSFSQCANVKTDVGLVRRRRHLTFPDQTTVVLTISLVKAFMTHAPSGWNIALEIDVLFPLPDKEFTNRHFRRKLHHKQKRELWEKIHTALDYYNINGRACVVRAICESRSHLAPPGKSLVHDLLRVIFVFGAFRAPSSGASVTRTAADEIYACTDVGLIPTFNNKSSERDEEFIEEMKNYYEFSEPNFCDRNDCPFSILDFVLSLNKK